jgi:ABC-2 type transport system ATP-binding protein
MPSVPAVIATTGLTKRYDRTLALDELDLEVPAGEVFGFLGPNGAGKTTTIRLLLGLIRPSAGSAQILGQDTWSEAVQIHRRLAFVPGELPVWPRMTGAEILELLGRLHGSFDADYRDELLKRFDFDPSKRARSYSKGNRQKIGLIAALMTRAEVLLMDEPTSGLDPLMEVVFRECVGEAKERGQTVFLSSHILSEVEALCDRVGILRSGRLVEVGTLAQLRHLSAQTVVVEYRGAPPVLDGVPGVEGITASDGQLKFTFRGKAGPLLAALAPYDIVSFTSREPSLEEVFLAHYGG